MCSVVCASSIVFRDTNGVVEDIFVGLFGLGGA
jgi:hypothetical protein